MATRATTRKRRRATKRKITRPRRVEVEGLDLAAVRDSLYELSSDIDQIKDDLRDVKGNLEDKVAELQHLAVEIEDLLEGE